ncbi:MAG: 3'-5' exonuclease [Anaerolineales bacterium]|nr:MAG: 3'-5' exonuclease [Anaerolineales bacterium]
MDTNAFFNETFVSIDVETSGPNPSQYSLLTIGACTIAERQSTFYIELKPVTMNAVPEALAVSRLSLERLVERGHEPAAAMGQFEAWLKAETPEGQRPIFVAFNAPFDWMFINDYFHRFLGRNPFGHAALDIKSFYMGMAGVPWAETSMRSVGPLYLGDRQLTHHALRDAMDQADLFRKLVDASVARRKQADTGKPIQQTNQDSHG